MVVCVKDHYGKYMFNSDNLTYLSCIKEDSGVDQKAPYSISLFFINNRELRLDYKEYETASEAYDYIKGQVAGKPAVIPSEH